MKNTRHKIAVKCYACLWWLCANPAHAQLYLQDKGLGSQYNSFLYFIHGVVAKICVLAGGALLVGGLAQYKAHRDNPSAVKITVPISMVVVGLLLLGLAHLPSPIHENFVH